MGLVDLMNTSSINYKKYFDSTSLLRGYEGKCFIEGDKILKFYFTPKDKKSEFIDFSVYNSPFIAFPINYYEILGKIVGEEMSYFRKFAISQSINDETDLQLLKKNYLNILKELINFRKIYMNDLCGPNILYGETGFIIIDTSRWVMRDSENYVSNEALFNEALMEQIFEIIELYYWEIENSFNKAMLKRGNDGFEMMKLLKEARKDSFYIIEILELFENMYNKEYGKHLNTLGDIENYTKILKNS